MKTESFDAFGKNAEALFMCKNNEKRKLYFFLLTSKIKCCKFAITEQELSGFAPKGILPWVFDKRICMIRIRLYQPTHSSYLRG